MNNYFTNINLEIPFFLKKVIEYLRTDDFKRQTKHSYYRQLLLDGLQVTLDYRSLTVADLDILTPEEKQLIQKMLDEHNQLPPPDDDDDDDY